MHGNDIEPSLDRLLDQYEDIGGPETYGPEGTAIILAIWRKSKKLGWRESFQMTNTELSVQTGIKSREAINNHRKKLASDKLIEYTQPPKGTPRGNYIITFELPGIIKAVRNMDNSNDYFSEPVRKTDNFSPNIVEPVRNMDNLTDTVLDLKDLTTTITTTTDNGIVLDGNVEPFIALMSAYCDLHKKLDFHVKPKERSLMHRMIAGGMPVPFIIRVMNQLYGERSKETNITSFLYYENPIFEAWHNEQSQTTPVEGVVAKGEVRQGTQHRNKKQQDLDDMDRVIEEERSRGAIPVS